MGSDLMIYGIGTDITKVSRFEKWVKNEEFITNLAEDRLDYPEYASFLSKKL